MKAQYFILLLLLLAGISLNAQYNNIEINTTESTAKDARKIAYTAKNLCYHWPKSSCIGLYEWNIGYSENGHPESVGTSLPTKYLDSLSVNRYELSMDDGTLVAEHEKTRELQVYDLLTRTQTKSLNLGRLKDFVIHPDGSLLAVIRNGKVDLIDIHSEKVLHSFSGDVDYLKFSPGGKYLALLYSEKLEVVNLWSGERIRLEIDGFVKGVEMSVNGKILASYTYRDIVYVDVFDMDNGDKLRKTIKTTEREWYHCSIHPEGKVIQVQGAFYNLKSKKPFKINSIKGFKFHPYLLGVFMTNEANGKIGTYQLN